jgi:catechol 2,3-dioxygenase-like lactoylglutathione lyase family enzyme
MYIKELILATNDPLELKAFYRDLLELPVTDDVDGFVVHTGSSKLVFKKAHDDNPFYHFAFTIPANAIEKAREWLANKVELVFIGDYESEIADFMNWHAKSVYFFDPAGNILELIARFDLDNTSEKPFSSAQILSISEAGLVFKASELAERTTGIMSKYNLSYFEKQPPLPHFKALGDDKGLFIIVPEHRNWYPTAIESGIFPIEIVFENAGEEYRLIQI